MLMDGRRAAAVIVDNPKRSDLVGRLFQVPELDDEIAGLAPEEHDGTCAGREPARAVDIGE